MGSTVAQQADMLRPRRVLASGGKAPVLMVVYECGKCGWEAELDAYDGPAMCLGDTGDGGHSAVVMDATRLVGG